MTLAFLDGALQRILMRRARRKFSAARPFVAGAERVLDVGCGEGYVAAEAAGSASFVVALDSRASCRIATRFMVADAAHLPFADDAFDVGLLAYVLHHTPDPDAVLREAVRTCRRVIVWESLFGSAAGRALLSFSTSARTSSAESARAPQLRPARGLDPAVRARGGTARAPSGPRALRRTGTSSSSSTASAIGRDRSERASILHISTLQRAHCPEAHARNADTRSSFFAL